MTDPDQRDVWVTAADRHVPAHRVPLHAVPLDGPHSVYHLACPPFLISGGTIITRAEAARLEAFPCARCFPGPLPPQSDGPA